MGLYRRMTLTTKQRNSTRSKVAVAVAVAVAPVISKQHPATMIVAPAAVLLASFSRLLQHPLVESLLGLGRALLLVLAAGELTPACRGAGQAWEIMELRVRSVWQLNPET